MIKKGFASKFFNNTYIKIVYIGLYFSLMSKKKILKKEFIFLC
jgi:hypothetical protein